MTVTRLVTNHKKTTVHVGTSGFTVTGIRQGDGLDVLMEFDQMSSEEGTAMVAMVLKQLEELFGEGYVAACIAHYAKDTGKKFLSEGDHEIGIIRGERRARHDDA